MIITRSRILKITFSVCQSQKWATKFKTHFWKGFKMTWGRCYDFKNIFAEKFCENIGVFAQTNASLKKNIDHNIAFREKR
jgi:hypothetical protein